MFRGKKSSNRIEISRLVQDLLNFGVLGSLWLWGWGMGGGDVEWLGVPPHTHMHIYMLNMIISIANGCIHWIWGNPRIPYDVIHVCM